MQSVTRHFPAEFSIEFTQRELNKNAQHKVSSPHSGVLPSAALSFKLDKTNTVKFVVAT